MALQLSRNQHAELLKWAASAGEQECCGLVLGEGTSISCVLLADNVAADPRRYFEIDPAILISVQKHRRAGGPDIVGYFHSHPNGLARPSATDVRQAEPDGKFWLIICDGQVSAWRPVENKGVVNGFEAVLLTVQG